MNTKPTFGLALIVAMAAAAPAAGFSHPDQIGSSARAKLERAEQRWEDARILNYSYRIRRLCFCSREFTRKVTIDVRNGKPRRTPRAYRDVNKVEKLFDVIRDGLDAEILEARYRSGTGVPRSIYIDRSFMIADEEIGYEITRFAVPRD
ncbi:MAG: hypothetical protein H0U42_00030 [Thermoleophilaceae bacterium]|nr:hypothetical protein [Thermoleophilaceae bacterium]